MGKKVIVKVLDDNGLVSIQGKNVYVKHVFQGESVLVEMDKGKVHPKLLSVKDASSKRQKVLCGIYEKCGGCSSLHEKYNSQLIRKKNELKSIIPKNLSLEVHDIHGMDYPLEYRNKAIVSFQRSKSGEVVVGMYEEDSHQVVSYDVCLLHDKHIDPIVQTILRMVKKYRVDIYDEKRRTGNLRHILIRVGKQSRECMVVFVTKEKVFPGQKKFVQELTKRHPYITTIIQNINTRQTSIVLGNEEKTWYGPGFIYDTLCGLRFRISAKSFYQINHEQCTYLYEKGLSLIPFNGSEVVYDTYCGIGTIGMVASKYVKEVVGIELNQDAIVDAKKNAQMNQIHNINFVAKDASDYMIEAAAHQKRVDVVIMDPPRSGSDTRFIQSLRKLNPKYVLYISCNPETQVRDMVELKNIGFVSDEMFLVDMFPNTKHVESIVLLKNNNY